MKTLKLLPLIVLFAATAAAAGDHRYSLPANYVAECGSCHVAYPPDLMSANGWVTTMQGLEKHFGTDASLDAKTQREIGDFLQSRASRRDKHQADGKAPRISESNWFRKEHRGQSLPAKTTSIAQCNACHTRAEQGDYSESSLKSSRR